MNNSAKSKILVVVTGGIAAYKAAEVVRRLVKQIMEVTITMTAAATEFVTPLTFQSLSGHPVGVSMFGDIRTEESIAHISFAQWADLVLVCPATANFIAKITHGIADDLCSSTLLATKAPLVICPAMNDGMWENPVTQENISKLKNRKAYFIGPESGGLACRTEGTGRMSEPETIAGEIARLLRKKDRPKVVVTAGGTRDYLDDVRVLTNLSTGRLGAEIVDACEDNGYEAVWLHSDFAARPRSLCTSIAANTVSDVEAALKKVLADSKVVSLIHCMAVSDFTVAGTVSIQDAVAALSKSRTAEGAEKELLKLASKASERKLPSSHAVLPILVPGKKLLDSIRKWAKNPKLFLVSFKLTSGTGKAELISISKDQLKRTRSNLVVANDTGDLSPAGHKAWLVSPSEVSGPIIGKKTIAAEILKSLPPCG